MKTLDNLVHPKNRYFALNITRPVSFFCRATRAHWVFLVGDFNDWQTDASPMKRMADGSWWIQVTLHPGHHRYYFLVNGEIQLDPKAQGVTRNDSGERVSVMAVS